jgi:hypothetical protein
MTTRLATIGREMGKEEESRKKQIPRSVRNDSLGGRDKKAGTMIRALTR